MCCCMLRNSQPARKLILFSDCFSLLFQLLVFFLLPGIFALTTPLGIFAHIAPEKVCAVSVRKTVKLSTMGHFLVLHTPNVHGPDHLLLIWPKKSRQMTSPETRANSVQRTYQKFGQIWERSFFIYIIYFLSTDLSWFHVLFAYLI